MIPSADPDFPPDPVTDCCSQPHVLTRRSQYLEVLRNNRRHHRETQACCRVLECKGDQREYDWPLAVLKLRASLVAIGAKRVLPAGTTVADSSRMSLPEKVDMIQERLGLAPGGESLVAAVITCSFSGCPVTIAGRRASMSLWCAS